MPVIFSGQPGRVAVLSDPAVPADIRPLVQPDPGISIRSEKSIITDVIISQQTNHQFLHTLGNDIFIYVFGDRIGQIGLRGISFTQLCDDLPAPPIGAATFGVSAAALFAARAAASSARAQEHGLERVLNYYKRNKLSSRRDPVKIAVGRTTFTGFVTGINTRVTDPKTWITEYLINVAVIPEKNDEESGSDQGAGSEGSNFTAAGNNGSGSGSSGSSGSSGPCPPGRILDQGRCTPGPEKPFLIGQ
jgi:hypothetical protein